MKNWMILSDDFPTPDVEVGGSHMAGWDPDRVPSITQWMDNYESTLNPRKMRTRSTP